MVKTIESRRQGGAQKEVVIELLGCVEHSTNGNSLGECKMYVP